MIIAIEGMDAAGKNTHSKLLANKLSGVVQSFPDYGTTTGKAILSHLKKEWACQTTGEQVPLKLGHLDAMVFQSLMTVNRLEVAHSIKVHVEEGRDIVFDRYWASGVVYGELDGLDPLWVRQTQDVLIQPDLWILIDIPLEESVKRRPERRDRYEQNHAFMEKVRDTYLKVFGFDDPEVWHQCRREKAANSAEMKSGWWTINGVGTQEEVHRRIMDVVAGCSIL